MELKHKIHGLVWDVTRQYYCKILSISLLSDDDQQWSHNGCPDKPMYTLRFLDKSTMVTSYTHYLTVKELDELYPYIGTDVAAIEVLYGE